MAIVPALLLLSEQECPVSFPEISPPSEPGSPHCPSLLCVAALTRARMPCIFSGDFLTYLSQEVLVILLGPALLLLPPRQSVLLQLQLPEDHKSLKLTSKLAYNKEIQIV